VVIHDRSYSRWKGDRAAPVAAATLVMEAGLKRGVSVLFRRKLLAVVLLLVAFGPFIVFLGIIYIRAYILGNLEQFGEGWHEFATDADVVAMTTANPEWIYFYIFKLQAVFVVLACVLLGSPLIAEDRRANALELYLSRPVTAQQYFLGKLATIATFLAALTILPASLLVLAQISVSWADSAELLRLLSLFVRTLVSGAVWVAIPAMTITAASSLTDRARNAAIMWLSVVVMLEFVVSNALSLIIIDGYQLLQFGFNIRQVMNWVLNNDADLVTTVPVWASALVLAGWAVLCLRVIYSRVRPVEVVA
jgi:ABC-type transport system involved in multi-copper enzyme maturation permease subunit